MLSLGLVALLISFSGLAITSTGTNAQFPGGSFGGINPSIFGALLGSQFFGDLEGMGTMFNTLFSNASDFSAFETVPNTYVFNVSESNTNTWGFQSEAYFSTVYNTSVGADPGVWASTHAQASFSISTTRTYLTVFIIWDPDKSLVEFINLIGSAIETFGTGDMNAQIASITNLIGALLNFNTIFTGDEVFTLASFVVDNMTYDGTYNIDNQLYYSQDDSDPFDINSICNPTGTDLMQLDHPMSFFTSDYSGGAFGGPNEGSNVVYQMWMVQLHIRNLHIGIDFSKLLGGTPEQALNEINIGFDIMTHRVSGLHVFEDANDNGMLDLKWDYNETEWESGNLTANSARINASETRYNYNIKDFTGIEVINPDDYDDDGSVDFGINLTGLSGDLVPFGTQMIYDTIGIANSVPADITQTSHIVHFDPVVSGNPATALTGEGNLKIDHVIGDWDVNGQTTGAGIANELNISDPNDMGLALSYTSLIFNFDFKLNTNSSVSMDQFSVRDDSRILIDATHDEITGDINNSAHIDGGLTIALGGTPITDITLTGDNYTTRGSTYPANASILPLAQMVFNFGAQGLTGENANTTLGLNMNLDTFMYAVSYSEWDGSEIVHDPVFTVHTAILPTFPTIAVVVLVVIIAVAAIAIVIHKKKKY